MSSQAVFLVLVALLIAGLGVHLLGLSRTRSARPGQAPAVVRVEVVAAIFAVAVVALVGYLAWQGNDARARGLVAAHDPNDPAQVMCARFANEFQETSSRWAGLSWGLGLAAALLAAVGGIVGSGRDGETRWYRRGAGVLLATLGSTLSATAAYSVSRSNAASAAAASATLALKEESSNRIYQECLEAKAQWLQSRSDSMDQVPPPGLKSRVANRTAQTLPADGGAADAGPAPSVDAGAPSDAKPRPAGRPARATDARPDGRRP